MGRLILLTCFITPLLTWQVLRADDDYEWIYKMRQSGEILPLEEILKISRQEVSGRVIEVELEQEQGALIYELEILDRYGRVWEIEIDAVSGQIIKIEED